MNLPRDYFTQTLKNILAIDSPTGFTKNVISEIQNFVTQLGYKSHLTNKGNLVVDLPGTGTKTVGISTHVDTLGLMVRGFNGDGSLSFTTIGGPMLPTLDGEYCSIYTRCGKVYTGTILSNSPASHVYKDAAELERNAPNMHIRLDEQVTTAENTKDLGILPGDFICYDPKTIVTENGFIKSRFLDDKLSASIVLSALKQFKDHNITPAVNAKIIFSTYEEVGHGLSHLPEGVTELLAIDMGCIGQDLSCTEYDVSICAKDSSGPYDYEFTSRLINLAKEANLSYAVDIYPYYGSDASAAVRAGHDVVTALIGPGVTASHGMERSHMSACENAFKLLCLYLTAK
ncbi:MAG: M42 family metallopeptidase [Defluviitaleaceae bacterium]|nr:M42 family metallopeptidase [Defluviitaleaceae bacterium]